MAKKKSSSRGSSARRYEPKCPAKYSLAAVNPMTGKHYKRPVCVRAAARKGKAGGVKLKTVKPRRGAEIMATHCNAGKLVKFNPNTGKSLKRPMCAKATKSGRAKLSKPVHQSVKVRKIIAVSGRR